MLCSTVYRKIRLIPNYPLWHFICYYGICLSILAWLNTFRLVYQYLSWASVVHYPLCLLSFTSPSSVNLSSILLHLPICSSYLKMICFTQLMNLAPIYSSLTIDLLAQYISISHILYTNSLSVFFLESFIFWAHMSNHEKTRSADRWHYSGL